MSLLDLISRIKGNLAKQGLPVQNLLDHHIQRVMTDQVLGVVVLSRSAACLLLLDLLT